ncbi:MAG: C_GCAxxG_C_C family protein [Chloroflexi bacterium]|nr:C_GCAxxG_C_C family protein [Chloroflexota bacterium]
MIAVGGYYLNPLPDVLVRASDPIAGGVGGSRQELCGALAGGVMVLGALWGRVSAQEDDKVVYDLAKRFRERFAATFGLTQCGPIRDAQPEAEKRCGAVVEKAARMLVEMIEEQRQQTPFRGAYPSSG